MSAYTPGKYAPLAEKIRAQRETGQDEQRAHAQQYAQVLTHLAADLCTLIKQAQEIPGTYRVWTRLYDARSEAEELAREWERRKP